MNKQQLLKFISECRPLLKTATPQQQLKIMNLIRESYQRIKTTHQEIPLLLQESDKMEELIPDYLEEK